MNKIWPYIAVFLLGGLLMALYAINAIRPSIITDSYIESVQQSVKKLKQSGENNNQDIEGSLDILTEQEPRERKKLLGRIFKRKNKKE